MGGWFGVVLYEREDDLHQGKRAPSNTNLDVGNDASVLRGDNCFGVELTCQVRVDRETLPVAAT